jgi:predicted membrane protein
MQNTTYQPLMLETTTTDWIKAVLLGILIPMLVVFGFGVEWAFAYTIILAAIYIAVLRQETPAAYLLLVEAVMIIGGYAFLTILTVLAAFAAALQ